MGKSPLDRGKPRTRLRILIIEPSGLLWGSERALLDLLSHLPSDSAEVTVACPEGTPLPSLLTAMGIRVVEGPIGGLHRRGRSARMKALFWLSRLIRKERPQVVHLNQAGLARIAAIAAGINRVRFTTHVRMQEDATMLGATPSLLLPDGCVAISRSVMTEVTRSGRMMAGRSVRLIHDPFDADAFAASVPAEALASVRRELGIPGDRKIVLHVGRVCAQKGQDLLVSAAGLLNDPGISYLIAGGEPDGDESDYRARLLSLVDSLKLGDRVSFLGERQDVGRLIAASDCVVMSSRNESFGRVLLESLALAVPVIGPDTAGPAEIIGNEERGFLFRSEDARSLADSIARCLRDRQSAQATSAAGSEWVREACSPSVHAASMLSFWDAA